jgi:hypothetical protein
LIAALVVATMLGLAPGAQATIVIFNATLDGLQETPPNSSSASGTASIVFDTTADTVAFNVPFQGLTPAAPGLDAGTDSHIHFGAPGIGGPVLLPLEPLAGRSSGTLAGTVNGSVLAPNPFNINNLQDVVNAGVAGNLYINLHSTAFPNGEIRGQLALVPEPSMVALLLVGLVGAGVARMRIRGTA